MDRPIDRRDFLQGMAITAAATGLAPELAAAAARAVAAQDQPGYYPALKTGMRGSHPGSFETAHQVRDDGGFEARAADTGETYDLVVVGAGISGLSTAHFYREAVGRGARILILDNHDDFGGHAKRNEYNLGGRKQIMNGGTAGISSPTPYSATADGLIRKLGVNPEELAKTVNDRAFYSQMGMGSAVFFDKQTFGIDKLVKRPGGRTGGSPEAVAAFLAQTPLSAQVQKDILALETGTTDYLSGKTDAEKKDLLGRMSYRDFLLNVAKVDPAVIPYYQHRTDGLWGAGIDAVSALDCWGSGFPGFQGMKLEEKGHPLMGYTPGNEVATGGSYNFAFPDGNGSVAYLLMRNLIPEAVPGSSVEDVVTARPNYARLDRAGQPIRVRLSSTVVKASNVPGKGVRVIYMRGGKPHAVSAKHCVLACYNMMIPYLVPELPTEQKAALKYLVKTPLVYTTVALHNWRAFHRLGVQSVSTPGGYHTSFNLAPRQKIGAYETARTPDEPILVHMTRTPASPGLNEREQHIAGRAELLATPFETFERAIRDEMGRSLSGGGFDPARDIAGITVNRWPHGYAPEYNALVDPPEGLPLKQARARFGAIAIANSDSGGGAYTDIAIDMAHRAVGELVG
ncbi:NAD(P)-binding protein [Phenylobacterium sp.]|jgi:spermidine dehydrogenase|uniref:NAD(P)/FAD-dependent oxidoreductase n=1 Tax=Phenylobacterium sp. TaxID=1871053 RepID=UPI0037839227